MVTTIPINQVPRSKSGSGEDAPSTFASQPSFAQKILNFSLTLAQASQNVQPTQFANAQGIGTPGTYNISGARSRVRVSNAKTPAGATADISIYGLDQGLLNEMTTLGLIYNKVALNKISVSAGSASGDDASAAAANQSPLGGFPIVFAGTIWYAFADYNRMPDVPLRIQANGGLGTAMKSVVPTSLKGSVSIVSIMQSFADALDVPLENNGVSGTLSNPYFPGSLLQQIYDAAAHANINAQLVDGNTKLAIWPRAGSRNTPNVPLISPDTGMIGYPSFAQNGFLYVKMLYNADVLYGGNIRIESSIPQANRTWTVFGIDYALDSLFPDGDWMLTALCRPAGASFAPPPTVGPTP